MTEIQKQKPYFYLKSKNEKLDDMIVREVNTTNNDSRYFQHHLNLLLIMISIRKRC